MSENNFHCIGQSLKLQQRQKRKIMKQFFAPTTLSNKSTENEYINHENGSNYVNCKHKANRIRPKTRQRLRHPANHIIQSSQFSRKRCKTARGSPREILQIPCFIFPRVAKNLPWRGRQTLCNQRNSELESEVYAKIWNSCNNKDFVRFLSSADSLTKNSNNSLTSSPRKTCDVGLVIGREKLEASTKNQEDNQETIDGRYRQRHNTRTEVGGGDPDSNETIDTENLEWYIQLASRCYNEGFQWHMNYLYNCSSQRALQKQKRIASVPVRSLTNTTNYTNRGYSFDTNKRQKKIYIQNYDYDDFNENDRLNCKFHIVSDHTQKVNSNNTSKSYVTCLTHNTQRKSMNSDGCFDSINRQTDEVIDSFCSLSLSCGTTLPQIILTDFTAQDRTPISTPLLLTSTYRASKTSNSDHHQDQYTDD